MRQIVLDTETTGLRVEDGHRLIEIGCLEMINRQLTGNRFHTYINPMREIDAGAMAVHGITNEFLQDKKLFATIVDELMDFVSGAELIIHNAPFDLAFINNELRLLQPSRQPITDFCTVVDTLPMARQLHVGQRNSLDALCKRYKVDNSKRDLHGALVDAYLLAHVYLAMTGGQGSFFDLSSFQTADTALEAVDTTSSVSLSQHQIAVIRANEDELASHERYLTLLKSRGKCVWHHSFMDTPVKSR